MNSLHSSFAELLSLSRTSGLVLKFKLAYVQQPITTAVENIVGQTVILKPYSLYGQPLACAVISASDIVSVKRLNVFYDDEVYVKLRELKRDIIEIRKRTYDIRQRALGRLILKEA